MLIFRCGVSKSLKILVGHYKICCRRTQSSRCRSEPEILSRAWKENIGCSFTTWVWKLNTQDWGFYCVYGRKSSLHPFSKRTYRSTCSALLAWWRVTGCEKHTITAKNFVLEKSYVFCVRAQTSVAFRNLYPHDYQRMRRRAWWMGLGKEVFVAFRRLGTHFCLLLQDGKGKREIRLNSRFSRPIDRRWENEFQISAIQRLTDLFVAGRMLRGRELRCLDVVPEFGTSSHRQIKYS